MNTATAVRFQSIPNPVRPFRWKRHWIVSGLVVAIFLAIPINNYVGGLRFEGNSAFSPILPFVLSLCILLPLLLIGTARASYRIFRKQEPWRKAGLLVLPYAALYGIMWLPIPSFAEGVAKSLRERASGEELVALARSMAESPPAWMKGESYRSLRQADRLWLASHPIVERAGLEKCPNVLLGKNTVTFNAGSPIADRWGIAISLTPGLKPEIPDDASTALPVFPDVWVFTLLD